jgi:hypothetical protein
MGELAMSEENEIPEEAKILLSLMKLIGDAAVEGDDLAKPYIDANAVRVVDGVAEFHKERFLTTVAKQMVTL